MYLNLFLELIVSLFDLISAIIMPLGVIALPMLLMLVMANLFMAIFFFIKNCEYKIFLFKSMQIIFALCVCFGSFLAAGICAESLCSFPLNGKVSIIFIMSLSCMASLIVFMYFLNQFIYQFKQYSNRIK